MIGEIRTLQWRVHNPRAMDPKSRFDSTPRKRTMICQNVTVEMRDTRLSRRFGPQAEGQLKALPENQAKECRNSGKAETIHLRTVDLNLFRVFDAIILHGSVSKATKVLSVTPSAGCCSPTSDRLGGSCDRLVHQIGGRHKLINTSAENQVIAVRTLGTGQVLYRAHFCTGGHTWDGAGRPALKPAAKRRNSCARDEPVRRCTVLLLPLY